MEAFPFRIAFCESEMKTRPCSNLVDNQTEKYGWQTQPFSHFPVSIVLEFSEMRNIQKISIISHEFKIAS
ncbi:MAG: hypothetical protein EZS28_028064 [Streblomastix strix]|uniref:Centrosomal protein CEP104 N-terminal domain-containing protein n=1 Tax=Streblomastix strix TaxID=222440 RepID=A0A5J4V1Z1_9EUKA|nr:MAG: hypothetical protein EZS28_028064 [Streblomastix strix]